MSESPAAAAGPASEAFAFVATYVFAFYALDLGAAFDAVQAAVARFAAFGGRVARWAVLVSALLVALATPASAAAAAAPAAALSVGSSS